MKNVIAIVLASAMLVACGEPAPPASPTDKPATPPTLSVGEELGKEYKDMLDDVVQEVGGYDDYDDFRQDADRYEAELKAWLVCIETHDAPSVVTCPPPEG